MKTWFYPCPRASAPVYVPGLAYTRSMSVSVSMNKNPTRGRILKVVLLGDGKVGKTSLMNRYISNKFDAQSFHTIGVEFLNKEVSVDDVCYTIQVWL